MTSSSKPKPLPEPTEEQLRLALRQLWRPGWPATLEAVLAHHTYAVCVRGLARNLGRAATRRAAWAAAAAPALPHTTPPLRAKAQAPRQPQPFDARKAAANDRDD